LPAGPQSFSRLEPRSHCYVQGPGRENILNLPGSLALQLLPC
jgi:hypothetical protein